MDIEKLAAFECIKVMPLRPNDVVVLKVDQPLSNETAEVLKKIVQDAIGIDRKVLVLESGIDIEVLRKEDAAVLNVVGGCVR